MNDHCTPYVNIVSDRSLYTSIPDIDGAYGVLRYWKQQQQLMYHSGKKNHVYMSAVRMFFDSISESG